MNTAVDDAIAKIIADGAAHGELIAADKAREVTVTAYLRRKNGDVDEVTVTGIAPFTVAETVGHFSGLPGWTVLGQPYASKSGMRSTIMKCNPQRGLGGIGLLTRTEAIRFADAVNEAVEGVSA